MIFPARQFLIREPTFSDNNNRVSEPSIVKNPQIKILIIIFVLWIRKQKSSENTPRFSRFLDPEPVTLAFATRLKLGNPAVRSLMIGPAEKSHTKAISEPPDDRAKTAVPLWGVLGGL